MSKQTIIYGLPSLDALQTLHWLLEETITEAEMRHSRRPATIGEDDE